MPTFTYKALRKGETQPYEDKIEATDRFEVYQLVRKDGAQVLSVAESVGSEAVVEKINLFLSHVSEADKIMLMRNLGAMIKAGLSLSRALDVLQRQTSKLKLKSVLGSIQKNIQEGSDLNSAMAKHRTVFTPIMIAMVKAGEESGNLASSCGIIADQSERSYELKKKVRGAMIYPSVIFFVLILIGTLMMLFIVPSLASTFRDMGSELPASTQIIIKLSDFLVNYTLATIGAFFAAIALFIAFVRTAQGKRIVETVVLHIPVVGTLVKETNSARTGRTLSSLLSSGVNVLHAFEITEEVVQNTHYKEVIVRAREQVQRGSPIAEIFIAEGKLYPPLVGELIAVGEETGNLSDMLSQVASFYENEVDQKTKNMSTIVEPVMMLVVGGAVGYFALAMISPIYSIVQTF